MEKCEEDVVVVVVGLSLGTGYGGTIPVSPVVHVAGSEGGPRPILFTAIT